MFPNSTGKSLRITGILLLILLIVGGGAALWFQGNYKRIIQKKLPIISRKATDSLYKIKAGDVDIDLPGRKVVITDFELIPDAGHIARLRRDLRLPRMLLSIHIDKVTMSDIDWSTVLASREIVCGAMQIEHPVVRITRIGDPDSAAEKEPKEPSAIQAIRAGRIDILNPDLQFNSDTTKAATRLALKGGSIRITEWDYDLRNPQDTTRLFYAANTALHFASFDIKTADGVYTIHSGDIRFDQEKQRFGIRGFRLSAALGHDAFYRRFNVQKEIYELKIPAFELEGLEWRSLLYDGAVMARSGSLDDAFVGLYMSRVPPMNVKSKDGKFPQQMLMKLKQRLYIPVLTIRNGAFAYTEKNERSKQEGTVAMDRIGGRITNLSNMPERLRKNSTLRIEMAGRFKDAPIRASFEFNTLAKDGAFRVRGGMGAMDGTKLNDILRPLALSEIRELQIRKVDFDIRGSDAGARGTMTLQYDGLKIALLKPDDGALEKQGLTSFLANGLLIHDRNPSSGGKLRTAHPAFTRDETKSFFNLVWKTIFTGTLQTASRDLIKLDRVVNNRQEKKEAARQEEERQDRKK